MKEIIEIFNWEHEGEYCQYFYAVENVDEFLEQTTKYLNSNKVLESKFPWHDPLQHYALDKRVSISFGSNADINHLATTYYLDYNNKYEVEKVIYKGVKT